MVCSAWRAPRRHVQGSRWPAASHGLRQLDVLLHDRQEALAHLVENGHLELMASHVMEDLLLALRNRIRVVTPCQAQILHLWVGLKLTLRLLDKLIERGGRLGSRQEDLCTDPPRRSVGVQVRVSARVLDKLRQALEV